MSRLVDLRVLELLAARLCHELISPIGAVANGVELLGEDDPEFVRDATALIGTSAKKAGQRLQFYRFAYGSSATGEAVGLDPRELVAGLFEGGKLSCSWRAEAMMLPVEWQKLACNMVVLVAETLPRGGTINVSVGPPAARCLEIVGAGEVINVTDELRAAVARKTNLADLTARSIQGYFTASLGESLGLTITLVEPDSNRLIVTAVP
jgi:histidine phosphotransferase ChpT